MEPNFCIKFSKNSMFKSLIRENPCHPCHPCSIRKMKLLPTICPVLAVLCVDKNYDLEFQNKD